MVHTLTRVMYRCCLPSWILSTIPRQNRSDLMSPSIFRTPDFLNQFPVPLEVRKVGIPLYLVLSCTTLRPSLYVALSSNLMQTNLIQGPLKGRVHGLVHAHESNCSIRCSEYASSIIS